MKPILKLSAFLLLMVLLFHISCQKELTCYDCKENKPPIANAGIDQKITLPTDSVTLDGSASTDADGTITSYKWIKIAGPSSSNIAKADSSKTITKALAMGVYKFELTVKDNGGLSAKDTVQVIVNDPTINQQPVANAGTDQIIILPTDTTSMNGSLSFDPDGTIVSYTWTKISGPGSFNISNQNSVQAKVNGLVQGIYQFELKVTDNGGLFAKDTMQVMVNDSGTPPITVLGCNASMSVAGYLPTSGAVWYSVAAGAKLLFIRGNGVVDMYDTLTHHWQTVTGMDATSNYLPGQVPYKTAKVGSKIVFSALGSQGQLINIYDALTNSWSRMVLSRRRTSYAMAVVGDKAYYAGDADDKMDVYDAYSNYWFVENFNGVRRSGMSAVSFGNKIYFAGGYIARKDSLVLQCDDNGDNCDSVPAVVSSDRVDILDVSANTWSVAHLSEARGAISTAILGNKIVFAGGEKAEGGFSQKVDFYDAVTYTWSATDVGEPIGNAELYGAYTAGNKLLLPGYGSDRKIHIYDGATNAWSVAQMPYPHETDLYERGMVTAVGNKLLFFLQYIPDPSSSRQIDIYDAPSNTWCHTQMNFDLRITGMVAAGNRVYIAGGLTKGTTCCGIATPTATVWHFDF